ncbi:MAG TPA: helix-turn-helix transcriptional regulator [Candidatus Limnocylindria bacterium]|nr:helix-turn-helix transcriptional regulator [Candidatus Limnocylindria bacterium]
MTDLDHVPARRSHADHLARGRELVGAGRTAEAIAYLRASAADLADRDPAGAATLLVDAVQPTLMVSGAASALTLAREAVAMAQGTEGVAELRAMTRLGDAFAWAGQHADAREAWGRAATLPVGSDPSALCERANALLRAGQLEAARTAAYEAVVRSREAESRADLADALSMAMNAEANLGNLHEALSCAEQCVALTEAEGGVEYLDSVASIAWIAALLGDVDRAEASIAEASAGLQRLRVTAPGGLAAGMLALGQGQFEDAVRAFEDKRSELPLQPWAQMHSFRPYVASLVEAYARVGRTDDARDLLDQFLEPAVSSQLPHLAAPALRARAAAYDDASVLDEALVWHAQWGNRFEEGRTLLARGEMLRRRKQRADARRDLAAAVQKFGQVGAATWQARAAGELRAAGERSVALPPPISRGPEALSQQESAIVELVAEGLSNREIASRLFLSVKTVEGHLTAVYGKLGIRSRGQLLAALLGGPQEDASSS